jgi:hypothetical protein
MGKKVGSFINARLVMFLMFVMFAAVIAGCATTKCAATETKQMAQQGATNLWQTIKAADDWIKTNLW